MTNEDLEQAAFWEEGICLDCQTILDSTEGECPECGGQVLPAATIKKVLSIIEEPDLPF